MVALYFGLVIFSTVFAAYLKEYFPEVTLQDGTLRGTIGKSWGGRSFLSFNGIPYAQPPIGNMRFKAPQPVKAWNGVLDASKEHAVCPQQDIYHSDYSVFGNEDCLFLNVYTQQISENSLYPVIVFIHGGGFMTDNANPYDYGPKILLDKELVLVTVNYRLGPLGFLSMEDEIIPGNNGLKDQNLALKWVKNNIRKFGGNPDKITLFGNSAGGSSVYFHYLSPLSRDLFSAGISSSGISTASWSLAEKGEAKTNARKLAKYLDCPLNSSEAMLNCLRAVDAYNIIKQSEKFMEFMYDPAIPFKPVVEPKMEGAFLSEHPIDIIKSGKLAKVPYMNGITTEDGAIKSAAIYNKYSLVQQLNQNFGKVAPMVLHYHLRNVTSDVTYSIRKFYFKDKDIDNNTKSELTDVVTDSLFFYPARITSELHSMHTDQPLYFYLFGYRGSVSMSSYFGNSDYNYGVVHCDDLLYVLSNDLFKNYTPTEFDLKMNDIMTTLLYNFAKTGNPTPEVNLLIPTKWEPVKSDKFQYYFIKDHHNITMQENLYEERFHFWKQLPIYRDLNLSHKCS